MTATAIQDAFDRKAFSVSTDASERAAELASSLGMPAEDLIVEYEIFAANK